MEKQKHNVQRPTAAYPSRLRDLRRILTRFRVHVSSTVTRLGQDHYRIRYNLFTKLAETSLNLQSSNAKELTGEKCIAVIDCPHCYSKIFRSIVETPKRGHRIENKDGGQKQISNGEFSK